MTGREHSRFACTTNRQATIRRLNDSLRRYGIGGSVMLSAEIAALSMEQQQEIYTAVRCYEDFTDDNDPYSEHDFGALDYRGDRILWKIDYYGKQRLYGSDDPADPKVTARVLTIMFASEY